MVSRCPSGCDGWAFFGQACSRCHRGRVCRLIPGSFLAQRQGVGRRSRWSGLPEQRRAAARVRAEELRPQAERIAVPLAETKAVWERRVIDRKELVEALAAPDVAGVPAAGARGGIGGGRGGPWRGVCRAALARGGDRGGARGGPPADRRAGGRYVGEGGGPGGETIISGELATAEPQPGRPLTAGQPCPEQPCQQTWNGPGRDQPGLFSKAWLTVHREVFRHLVRERLGAAAAQVSWSAPRPIRVAGGLPHYGIHAPVPSVRIRGVRTFPLMPSAAFPARRAVQSQLLPGNSPGEADSGVRPCCERPSLASPRTPVQTASSPSGPGNGIASRLTADSLLAAHPCNQLRLLH